jgi:uncharacterized lipoprotein YajG
MRLDVTLKATLPVDCAGFLLASCKAHAQTFMNTIALKLLSSSSICVMCSTVCLRQRGFAEGEEDVTKNANNVYVKIRNQKEQLSQLLSARSNCMLQLEHFSILQLVHLF